MFIKAGTYILHKMLPAAAPINVIIHSDKSNFKELILMCGQHFTRRTFKIQTIREQNRKHHLHFN